MNNKVTINNEISVTEGFKLGFGFAIGVAVFVICCIPVGIIGSLVVIGMFV
jgi:hypothetical protein